MSDRILYVSHATLPSRAANVVHVMKMANAYRKAAVDAQLVFMSSDPDTDLDRMKEEYGVDAALKIILFRRREIPGWILIFAVYCAIYARLLGFKTVHTRLPRVGIISALLGLSTLVEVHQPSSYRALRLYLRVARRPKIVVITEALRRRIVADLKCDVSCVILAPDAADPFDCSVDSAKYPEFEYPIIAGYLGHLYKGKGIEVIEKLAERCPEIGFAVVGGQESDLVVWREKTEHLENLRFVGHVPHSQTTAYLKSFDIALLPNQSFVGAYGDETLNISQWTSPLKAFEYMSAGLSIIASNQANLREVFEHGRNALLCDSDDIDCWHGAVKKLAHDEKLRQYLSTEARNDFKQLYSWQARAEFLRNLVH